MLSLVSLELGCDEGQEQSLQPISQALVSAGVYVGLANEEHWQAIRGRMKGKSQDICNPLSDSDNIHVSVWVSSIALGLSG